MPERRGSRAVLFADVSGSTHLYDQLGDTAAHRIVGGLVERLSEAVASKGGLVVKTIGDEVMATFEEAEPAVACACAMQRSLAGAVHRAGALGGIRIGLNFGPVIDEDEDVFGDTVNVAARLVSLAKAGQILTTGETADRLAPERRSAIRFVDHTSVRGKEEEIVVFEVLWQPDAATAMVEIPGAEPARSSRQLRLRLGDQWAVVGPHKQSIRIGRDPDNDLVVPVAAVSRWHARIEQHGDSFLLIDESTNGTFVTSEGEVAPRYVRHDEIALAGRGTIALGLDPREHLANLVRYEVGGEAPVR